MPMQSFGDRLTAAIAARRSRVIVGLDPNYRLLPPTLRESAETRGLDGPAAELWALERFCMGIIKATAPHACAFKPQIAFFERYGSNGLAVLERVLAAHPGELFIMDCKRGDIGSTSEAYARAYFSLPGEPPAPLDCAAVTHNPYLGYDTLAPYLPYLRADRGMFLLAKTSNPSSGDFQDLLVNDRAVCDHVAERAASWGAELLGESGYSSLGLVVGATYPESAEVIRRIAPACYILVPGLESQGGQLEDARHFVNADGGGAVFNFARAIIYAHASELGRDFGADEWAGAAGAAAARYRDALNSALGAPG